MARASSDWTATAQVNSRIFAFSDVLNYIRLSICQRADGSVNNVCEKHGGPFHVLVRLEEAGLYVLRWRIVNLFILLAKLGANPLLTHNGRTALQELKRIKLQHLAKYPMWLMFGPEDVYTLQSLNVVRKILQHYEQEGTWPDFEPIIQKYGLEGPATWEVNESGEVVLGDTYNSAAEDE